MANCFEFGFGIEKDEGKAFHYYYEACESYESYGESECPPLRRIALGRCYEFGIGTDIDLRKASDLYTSVLNGYYGGIKVGNKSNQLLITPACVDIAVLRFRMGCLFQKELDLLDKKDKRKRRVYEKQATQWFDMADDMGYDEVLDKQFQNNFRDVLEIWDEEHNPLSFNELLTILKSGRVIL